MTGLLVHIGYHKTGTSLLQDRLFCRGDLGFQRLEDDRRQIFQLFVDYAPFERPGAAQRALLAAARERAAEAGQTLVISHERLSGYPASGGFDARLIAERIAVLAPDAKILIAVREQASMIRSYYLQYITDGGDLPFEKFVSRPDPRLHRVPGFDARFYEYDACVAEYQRLFGAEKVLTFPFERFRSDGLGLAADIVRFAWAAGASAPIPADIFDDEVNAANPALMQQVRRLSNGLLSRNQLSNYGIVAIPRLSYGFRKIAPLFGPFRFLDSPMNTGLQRKISAFVGERYSPSNRRLEVLTGLDLKGFRYT